MTIDEIRTRYPNASKSFIARNIGDQGAGTHTSGEKFHVLDSKPRIPTVEKAVRPKFRIAIVLRYSDKRIRDPDASLSTILDALITARRQLEGIAGNIAKVDIGKTG